MSDVGLGATIARSLMTTGHRIVADDRSSAA